MPLGKKNHFIFKISAIVLFFSLPCIPKKKKKNMNIKGSSLTLVLAIFVALLSTKFIIKDTILLGHLISQDFTTSSTKTLQTVTTCNLKKLHRRHHHHHNKSKSNVTVCDDFPPNFPPPDTNTTSILCVDHKGCCNFTTVQSAVDAVALFSAKRTIIWINTGVYYEKVMIPKTKPNITFQGQGFTSTSIAWNNTANSSGGTFYSASVMVFADNFIAKNISFMNVAPIAKPGDVGAQAVAIRIGGDQAAFWGCGFFSSQDTLHDDRGRHYFRDCFVQGSIDFIFGDARSLFENCQLSSIAAPIPVGQRNINGVVTAHGRASNNESTGYVFLNCTIGGTGRIWLGRAWRPFSRAVFAYTFMSDIIAPEGWNDFNDPTRDQTIFYGEYKCSGPGSNTTMRASYVLMLNDTQASPFINVSYVDGDKWLQPFNA